ncbi:hypothetical protein M9H77_21033 [Catharanthus roseus]|uniref:Uncharacterized protein n=1 Tax=Catharanthus roseus TaxID=4058 RepID=A0ACC0AMW3_CATRO|nr:hypothetical protein M9H77_21033 [Catharanthus roseus]
MSQMILGGTSFNPLTALLQRKSIREVGELIHSQSFKSKTYCLNALEGNRTLIMHLHSKLIDTQKDQYIFILMGLSCMATKYKPKKMRKFELALRQLIQTDFLSWQFRRFVHLIR